MSTFGRIFFRTDASTSIGSGHVMRCLTLADELNKKGWKPIFISRDLPGNMFAEIKKRDHILFPLPSTQYDLGGSLNHNNYQANLGISVEQDATETLNHIVNSGFKADWLVVDHYSLSREWEQCLRKEVEKVFVIDDLAERYHECDLLLNQNHLPDIKDNYNKYINNSAKLLLGPQYAILRPEFRNKRKTQRKRDGSIRNILVYYGNVDPTNETGKALEAIDRLERPEISLEVVIGNANPYQTLIKKKVGNIPNATLHIQIDHLADLMANADLALGAGGTTTWERIYMGLPAIVTTIADNQRQSISAISRGKGVIHLGASEDINNFDIFDALKNLIDDENYVQKLIKDTRNMNVGKKFDKMIERLSHHE